VVIIKNNNLAKFGYKLNMKLEKKKTQTLYILGCLLELIEKIIMVWGFYPSKFGEFGIPYI
jgi:hypothetical protein